jgi:transposase InsO family protein
VAARTVSDAVVVDALIGARTDAQGKATPESLDGRRKMTALLRRRGLAVAHCTVDRLMRELGMNGVRRGKAPRTTSLTPTARGPVTC